MTEMKRVTVAIPDELDQRILELKKSGSGRESYSEIVRQILDKGLDAIRPATAPPPDGLKRTSRLMRVKQKE